MFNQFIENFNESKICDFILTAQKRIFISLPNIDDYISILLCGYKEENPDIIIYVIVDNDERNFRNGYGEINAIKKLREKDIPIFEMKGNVISFIICDERGYYLFPQSKIIANYEDIKSNAVMIDPISTERLINYLFPPSDEMEILNRKDTLVDKIEDIRTYLMESEEEIERKKPYVLECFNEKDFKEVEMNIAENPPLSPDLKRIIEIYNTKIQYVTLIYHGARIEVKKIELPNIYPIENLKLKKRLITKLKIFEDVYKKENFKKFIEIRKRVNYLRKRYLRPINSRKGMSIIDKSQKSEFLEKFNYLKKKIEDHKMRLQRILESEINNIREDLKIELEQYFSKNTTFNLFEDENLIDDIIYNINFPNPAKIVGNINLEVSFYDLTETDFSDEKLLTELQRKGIIKDNLNNIIKFSKAIGIKDIKEE